ncbi:MAG: META domain-containing protein [Sinobacterium sp.]|nr:META domain-containing protein [Sinobacterium sp.]
MRQHHAFYNTLQRGILNKAALSSLLATVLLSACSTTPESQLSNRWIVSSIAGNDVLEQHTPWLEFNTNFDTHEGELKGHSGCNRFFARYKIKDNEIAFSPIGSTRKACPGPEMKQEDALFKLLTTTMTLSLKKEDLVFTYNDQAVITLEREPEFITQGNSQETKPTTDERSSKK